MKQRITLAFSFITLFFLQLFISGCSFISDQFEPEISTISSREVSANLTKAHAELRREMIDQVDYQLWLELGEKGKIFKGRVVIDLLVQSANAPLTIDFTGGSVNKAILNEQNVNLDHNGFFITVPQELLKKGQNTLEIEFEQNYSSDGNGLFRFRDPEDQRTYLYSNFEPYRANKMFPVLDQPDLKASFKLSVKAPESWQVVSTKRERKVVRDGRYRWWYFPASESISPYIFSVHAGHYHIWEDKHFRIPLRLMVRESQKNKVHPEEWFRLTRAGFDYFEDYFDSPYAYSKYDQLIVPDFNIGGMENAAAVTYNENTLTEVLSHDPANPHRLYVSQLLFHEMSHMWFGNLVTMRWWNGLWLNESFADLMSFMAMEYGAFQPGWLSFNSGAKRRAYYQDQQPGTHPIARPVPSIKEAYANFDSITYGKGAAALQQLRQQLEPDVFRQGIREYLKQHADNSTVRADFITALESPSGRSLDEWQEQWLETAGVNEIQTRFSCKKGVLHKLELLQMPAKTGDTRQLREQKITIALLTLKDGRLNISRELTTSFHGKRTSIAVTGRHPCPVMAYPNSNDQAYAVVRLDEDAREVALTYPANSTLLRNLILQSLKEDLREGLVSLQQYADLLIRLTEQEKSSLTRYRLLQKLFNVFYLVNLVRPSSAQTEQSLIDLKARIENLAWQKTDLTTDEESQFWFDLWVNVTHTRASLQRVADILDSKKTFKNFPIQQYQRWSMIQKLSEFDYPGADQRIEQELTNDKSADGQHYALTARVLKPTVQSKQYWLKVLLISSKNRTATGLYAISSGLFPVSQMQLSRQLAEEIISYIPDVTAQPHAIQEQLAGLFANECSNKGVQRLKQTQETFSNAENVILQGIKNSLQQTERCIAMTSGLGK